MLAAKRLSHLTCTLRRDYTLRPQNCSSRNRHASDSEIVEAQRISPLRPRETRCPPCAVSPGPRGTRPTYCCTMFEHCSLLLLLLKKRTRHHTNRIIRARRHIKLLKLHFIEVVTFGPNGSTKLKGRTYEGIARRQNTSVMCGLQ